MPHTTFTVGRLQCHALEGGRQHLDGGAMFGVVPKPLWERRIVPDERNRIPLALRCLLVEHDDGPVLIDTGLGNKETAKFKDIYGVENEGRTGRTCLEDALAERGYRPEDVRWVINTHLHFDHAGGNTFRDPDGGVALTFPRARYVVQKGELDFASHTNERTAASYLAPNFATVPFTLGAHERAPAASLDHGLRLGAARHPGIEAPIVRASGARGVALTFRARSGGSGRPVGKGRQGIRSCGPA